MIANISVTSKSRKLKRKRGDVSSRESSDGEESDDGTPRDSDSEKLRSRLAKRIHTAKSRRSHLSRAVVASNGSSAIASPNGSSQERAPEVASASGSVDGDSADDGDVEDSDLDEWADEFEKELG